MVKAGLAAAILCISMLALFACGDDGDGDDPPETPGADGTAASGLTTPTVVATPEPDPTQVMLDALTASLVTPAQLGPDWEERATDVPAETAESMCDAPVRIIAPDILRTLSNTQQSGRLFAGHGVSAYADEENAAAAIDAVRQALAAGCTEMATTSRNTTTNWVVGPTEFAQFGEESLAVTAQTQFPGVPDPSSGYFVLIRRGPYVAVVIDISLISVDAALTEQFAATADANLKTLAESSP